jgi:hypothetical protein
MATSLAGYASKQTHRSGDLAGFRDHLANHSLTRITVCDRASTWVVLALRSIPLLVCHRLYAFLGRLSILSTFTVWYTVGVPRERRHTIGAGLVSPFLWSSRRMTSNQALERTAARCAFTFQMAKTVSIRATLAPGGGRSACSR